MNERSIVQDFNSAASPDSPSHNQNSNTPSRKPHQRQYVLPPPSLGPSGHSRHTSSHTSTPPRPPDSKEDIDKWALKEATRLKTDHAQQSLELENQHYNAIASKTAEIDRRTEEHSTAHSQLESEIDARRSKTGLSGLFYALAGHQAEDNERLQQSAERLTASEKQGQQEKEELQQSLEDQRQQFEKRCENECKQLADQIDQAHHEQRIPEISHEHSDHERSDSDSHQL